ncbi:hypothetical protein HanPI659440_Chr04g0145571 [Helianthus annuus]|nr:hypothetical protein HanPI659440_Chr04g0145571 [Helianthus annuus]
MSNSMSSSLTGFSSALSAVTGVKEESSSQGKQQGDQDRGVKEESSSQGKQQGDQDRGTLLVQFWFYFRYVVIHNCATLNQAWLRYMNGPFS